MSEYRFLIIDTADGVKAIHQPSYKLLVPVYAEDYDSAIDKFIDIYGGHMEIARTDVL